MQERVQHHRGVAGGQYEAIAVRPCGIGRIVAQELLPQRECHWRQSHRRSRVARLGLLDRVDRERPDRIDAQLVGALAGEIGRLVMMGEVRHGEPGKMRGAQRLMRQRAKGSAARANDRRSSASSSALFRDDHFADRNASGE